MLEGQSTVNRYNVFVKCEVT